MHTNDNQQREVLANAFKVVVLLRMPFFIIILGNVMQIIVYDISSSCLVIMLNVILLCKVMLNVLMLSVLLLNVVMLSAVVKSGYVECHAEC